MRDALATLTAQRNKTDRNDARGITYMMLQARGDGRWLAVTESAI